MSKTLYRTYRPKNFSDVLGQDAITKTLQNAITSNRIGHAYLFTGPRGTGKTTVARIFANAVNTQKRKDYTPVSKDVANRLQDGTSMDIIEIDAASNTGVDDIRKLKETVSVSPTEANYKIYIIDEVHMLSTNAFNALLKTLEEPPEHVIFILATTEIHKVPDTILSRCQRFDFSRFSVDDITKKLKLIAKNEKVKIDAEALEMIAISADGGMRDAESLLAQVFALEDKNITVSTVAQILGTTASEDVIALLKTCVQTDTASALSVINSVVTNGYNLETFIRSIIEKLRILLFLSISSESENISKLINIPKSEIDTLTQISNQTDTSSIITMIEECVLALQKTKSAIIPQLPLEIAVVNICSSNTTPSQQTENPVSTNNKPEEKTKPKTQPKIPQKQSTNSNSKSISTNTTVKWESVLKNIEKKNKSLSSLLSQCNIEKIDSNSITLITEFTFYKEKILQANNKAFIEENLQSVFSTPLKIEVLSQKTNNDSKSSELLSYASQLLGGAVTQAK